MTHPRATFIQLLRCPDPDCGCVHVLLADDAQVVIAEAVLTVEYAQEIGTNLLHFAAEHGGKLN